LPQARHTDVSLGIFKNEKESPSSPNSLIRN
jgi:hypothetical protein